MDGGSNELRTAAATDQRDADEAYADLYETTEEAVLDERDRAIRAALVKPGSQVWKLLGDHCASDEYASDIDSMLRMAADVLASAETIGLHWKRIANRAVNAAAREGLHAAVLQRLADEKSMAEEDRAEFVS